MFRGQRAKKEKVKKLKGSASKADGKTRKEQFLRSQSDKLC